MSETADAATTLDAFHRGDFHLVQPAAGHRSGMDAMVLAAAVPSGFAGMLADLGAGAGAAGLAVASRCAQARVVLVERSPEMAAHARASIAHPLNARLGGRAQVLVADVTLAGPARVAAGLADSSFDFAIMNPPFNAGRDRPSPDPLRRAAHVMEGDLFAQWIRTAAAIVRPRGGLALIARPASLAAVLAAVAGRFGGCRIVPVLPFPDQPAIRFVLRATRASRAAPAIEPPLVLHESEGYGHTPRTDAVSNGRATLFGD